MGTAWHSALEGLRSFCPAVVLMEIGEDPLPWESLFTPREAERAATLGPRRLRSYAASRTALKSLCRLLGLVEMNRPDSTIETLGPDRVKPCLAGSAMFCSVAHKEPLVLAVAHTHPVGVDLEPVQGHAGRVCSQFMSPGAGERILRSPLGEERAAARVFTAAESAVKAGGLDLIDSLRKMDLIVLGEAESLVRYGGQEFPVHHWEAFGHVITLMVWGGS